MLTLFMFTLTLAVNAMVPFEDVEDECIDKSPYCTANDCKIRPGYALEYCKKTCGNCEPFCFNSLIISCKDSRKHECDSMLKDYCPLLCGACRAKKKKTSKRKGNRLMSKNPASIAKLGILQKFTTPNLSKSNHSVHNTSLVPIIPAVTAPSASAKGSNPYIRDLGARLMSNTPVSVAKLEVLQKFSTSKIPDSSAKNTTILVPLIPEAASSSGFSGGSSTAIPNTPIFRPSTKNKDFNPIPFSDTSSPESSPIVVEEDEEEGSHHEFREYVERLPDPDVEATDNDVFASESVRIILEPPWPRAGPQDHFSKFPYSLGRPSIPTLPTEASKRFYPSLPPPRWLLPHQEDSHPYPVTHSAFFPKSYSQDIYGHPGSGHHLESLEDASMNLGELIALLGCRDKDPSICSKITDESCLSRPGYYSKLCPVKCRNCNGLQCLDSIKIDCNKVWRLGGCKLPMAGEYCPKTCRLCALPARIAESLPPCKDELDTCENLAASGVCDHPYSKKALRTYCAKSCGHCRESQYYMNDAMYRQMPKKKQRKPSKMPLG